ncbi:MAG: HEPN domain-containing protein [Archaeoglobaceae archaeon]
MSSLKSPLYFKHVKIAYSAKSTFTIRLSKDRFKENARFNFERKDYDLAMFHIEQAMQLLI